MAFAGFDPDTFRRLMRAKLTPSQAVATPEMLKGRTRALNTIERALNSPGKHVFIYGDRGVGKTSLAQTAAAVHQSSDAEPVLVGCGGKQGFLAVVRDAVNTFLMSRARNPTKKSEQKVKLGGSWIGFESSVAAENYNAPLPESVNEAVNLLRMVERHISHRPVIIFDEFDQLATDQDRKLCANFLKQLSDNRLETRCFICGIGSSLEGLIGVHMSAGRYVAPIELDRLPHEALWEIVQGAAEPLGVHVQRGHLIRLGQISDGFPSYVHLIAEHMLWTAFEDEVDVTACSQVHFAEGIRRAVAEAEPMLKAVYDAAVKKYSDDYKEVLWALADAHPLSKQTTAVYDKSYQRIMDERLERKRLTKAQFSQRLNALKSDRHGSIVTGTGAGWYEFRENVVRGYVRLRAENEGILIGAEGYA